MENCIFCKIVKGEASCHKIWEDGKYIAILSIYPNTPGFTVVISKEHKPSYVFANDDITISELTIVAKKVARILDATFDDVGRTGMFFEGFGVDHLHAKLFPMHGTKMDKWEPIESGDKVNTFFDKYPGYLSSNSSERADDKQLSELADKMRQTAKKLNI